jgi:hypothetical protein
LIAGGSQTAAKKRAWETLTDQDDLKIIHNQTDDTLKEALTRAAS